MPPRVLHAPGSPDDRRAAPARSPASRRPTSITSPTTARDTGELLRVFRTMINHLFPVTRIGRRRRGVGLGCEAAERIRRGERLRRRPARAAARRPPAGPDRPGAQPSARGPRHPRRRRLRPDPGRWPRFRPRPSRAGEAACDRGEVAVVTLAAGVGSRWTTGAGVVKAVNPFVTIDGRHRSFLEIHLAKTRKSSTRWGSRIPHVVTTSYLTHAAIERHLRRDRQLRPRRASLPLARAVDRPAADPDDPRPDVPLGRGQPRDARREQAEGPRRRPPRDPRVGQESGRGDRLHRQRADPAIQPARPLLRGAQPAPQRRARPDARSSIPNLKLAAASTTSTPWARPSTPGVLGLAIESRPR